MKRFGRVRLDVPIMIRTPVQGIPGFWASAGMWECHGIDRRSPRPYIFSIAFRPLLEEPPLGSQGAPQGRKLAARIHRHFLGCCWPSGEPAYRKFSALTTLGIDSRPITPYIANRRESPRLFEQEIIAKMPQIKSARNGYQSYGHSRVGVFRHPLFRVYDDLPDFEGNSLNGSLAHVI